MISHNMTWIKYPSKELIEIEDIIMSQTIISRFMHIYIALFVPISLVAGTFNLTTFIKWRARLGKLDLYLLDLTVTNLLVTLLSFTAIARPDYILTTNLNCGALSFFFNICYFNAQYVQIAILYTFLFQDYLPCLRVVTLTKKPLGTLSLVFACAFSSSLAGVMLLGTAGLLPERALCQVDPLTAWYEYEIVKFSLGFGVTLLIEMVFFTLLIGKLVRRDAPPQKDNRPAYLVMLTITLIMFACRLFYNIMLLNRSRLKLQRDNGSPREELIMNIAELVLFGESCANNLAILFLHKPCKLALNKSVQNLTKRCRREEETHDSVPL
ncbi:C-X-C chemokine receptor type 1-like [Petaurus breviceps papuanus]|uniref:C-X-C chemokine receptor type 1-like n=1 Tax=Petaurus breviceps papuanus TaxID=3040969 RepID=UPI0036DAE748